MACRPCYVSGDPSPSPAATFRCQRPNPTRPTISDCMPTETYRVGAFPLTDDLYVIISSIPFQLRVKLEANVGKFRNRLRSFSAQVERSDRSIYLRYSLLLGSVLESIMIGDSVFRRQPTSALNVNLRLGRKYTSTPRPNTYYSCSKTTRLTTRRTQPPPTQLRPLCPLRRDQEDTGQDLIQSASAEPLSY